jgi:hypothetical protein
VPNVPAGLSGRTTLCIDGAVLATGDPGAAERIAEDLLGPLRSIAEPLVDTWEAAAPSGVLQAHMDPDDPVAFIGDHMLLGDIGDDGIAEFLRVLGEGSGSPFVVAGLRQLGGAFSVHRPGRGVLDHLDAHYSYAGSGVPVDPVTPEALRAHHAVVRAALRRWDTGRTAPSFVEDFRQPQAHLRADRVYEVDQVRARIDPDGLFGEDIAPNSSTSI